MALPLIKTKNECFDKFKEFKALVEKQLEMKIDNGDEFISKQFRDFLKNEGIAKQTLAPHTPQENGATRTKTLYHSNNKNITSQ